MRWILKCIKNYQAFILSHLSDRFPSGIVELPSQLNKIPPYCFLLDRDDFYDEKMEEKYKEKRKNYINKFIKTIIDDSNKELGDLIIKIFKNDDSLIVGKLCALWYS